MAPPASRAAFHFRAERETPTHKPVSMMLPFAEAAAQRLHPQAVGDRRYLPRGADRAHLTASVAGDAVDLDHRQDRSAPHEPHRGRGVYHRGQARESRRAARAARAAARPAASTCCCTCSSRCAPAWSPAQVRAAGQARLRPRARARAAVAVHQRAHRAAHPRARARQLLRLHRGARHRASGCCAGTCRCPSSARAYAAAADSGRAADARHQPLLEPHAAQLARRSATRPWPSTHVRRHGMRVILAGGPSDAGARHRALPSSRPAAAPLRQPDRQGHAAGAAGAAGARHVPW